MKYSKELHDKLRNRTGLHIFNHQVGVDSEDIDAILDEIERLQTEFDAMKAKHRWIPVSERLPECEKDVLVFWGKALDGSKVDWFGTAWRNDSDDGKWCTDPIVPTHWMPLPEPPNDTQTETFVYGKDSKPIPCPCGKH